jgi:coatomer subunit beta
LLVRTLHSASIKFPDVAQQIFPVLMEFLSDESETAAADVLIFVREAIQRMPHLRSIIVHQLLDVFGNIRNSSIYRAALWILGEYSDTSETIVRVFELTKKSVGELSIVESELREKEDGEESAEVKTEHKEKKEKVTF